MFRISHIALIVNCLWLFYYVTYFCLEFWALWDSHALSSDHNAVGENEMGTLALIIEH